MPEEKSGTSFWKTLPGILTALASFIATVVGVLVGIQQLEENHNSDSKATVSSATNIAATLSPSYQITGHVYDSDNDSGLPLVGIAYVPAAPANSKAIDLVTADTSGSFSFDSSQIKPEQFPIHLQMTYRWARNLRVIPWDQTISFLSDKTPLILYMSLHDITNRNNRVSIQASHLNLLLLTNSVKRLRVLPP